MRGTLSWIGVGRGQRAGIAEKSGQSPEAGLWRGHGQTLGTGDQRKQMGGFQAQQPSISWGLHVGSQEMLPTPWAGELAPREGKSLPEGHTA